MLTNAFILILCLRKSLSKEDISNSYQSIHSLLMSEPYKINSSFQIDSESTSTIDSCWSIKQSIDLQQLNSSQVVLSSPLVEHPPQQSCSKSQLKGLTT